MVRLNLREKIGHQPIPREEEAMTRLLAACVAVAAYALMWMCAVWEALP